MKAALAGALIAGLSLLAAPVAALDCRTERFENTTYDLCVVDLATDDLRLWLDRPDGKRYLSLGAVADATGTDGTLAFAMNAGMYHPDRAPVGHLVIEGKELMRVITSAGPGNFGMLPNGVFCWGEGQARVTESRAYARARPACRFATQSGPMLVIDGTLHHRFLPDSTSTRVRNGVGVRKDGREAVFAITRSPVTFHAFARFFRDQLGTGDALYLDGRVSRMYAPTLGRRDRGGRTVPSDLSLDLPGHEHWRLRLHPDDGA